MKDVRAKQLHCCQGFLVWENYIETGYVESYIPGILNVRFITINDSLTATIRTAVVTSSSSQ